MDIIFDQEADIGLSSKEPDEFSYDSFPVNFFRREEWKTL